MIRGDDRARGVAGSSVRDVNALLWQRKTGGVAANEPVVRGGLLYFAGRDRRVEIFHAATGDRVFRARFDGPVTGVVPGDTAFVFATDQEERRLYIYSNSPVRKLRSLKIPTSPAPPRLLDDGSILFADFHGRLSRLRPDGEEMWSVETRGVVESAPTVADSLVLLASGRSVTAFRLDDGSQVWSHRATGAVVAAPAADDRAYFGSADSIFYAVSLSDGAMEWFFAASGQMLTTPAVGPDRVYVAANDRRVYALDKESGRLVWSYDTGAAAKYAPALAGDVLVVGAQTARLILLDAATGDLLSSFPLRNAAASAPVVANGRIYIADTRRRLYCFGFRNDEPPSDTTSQ